MALIRRRPLGSTIPRSRFAGFQSDRLSKQMSADINEMSSQVFRQAASRDLGNMERRLLEGGLGQVAGVQQGEEGRLARPSVLGVEEDTFFLGGLVHGGGSFLSGAMDFLSRPSTAVSGAVLGAMGSSRVPRGRAGGGEGAWEGFIRGLTGTAEEREHYNFATVLQETDWDWAENETARNVVGMALDLVTAPDNILFFTPVPWVRAATVPAGKAMKLLKKVPAGPGGRSVGGELERGAAFIEKGLARGFSRRLGRSSTTERELEILARQYPETGPGAKQLNEISRRIENMRRAGDAGAMESISAGMRRHMSEEQYDRLTGVNGPLRAGGTVLVRGPSVPAPQGSYADLVEGIGLGVGAREGPEAARRLGRLNRELATSEVEQKNLAVLFREWQGSGGGERLSWRQAEDAAKAIDREMDDLGLAGFVRFLKAEYESNLKLVETLKEAKLNTGGLVDKYMDTTLKEGFYFPAIFASRKELLDEVGKSPSLRSGFTRWLNKRNLKTPEEAIESGQMTDIMAALSLDIGQKRVWSSIAEIYTPGTLRAMNIRTVNRATLAASVRTLEKSGLRRTSEVVGDELVDEVPTVDSLQGLFGEKAFNRRQDALRVDDRYDANSSQGLAWVSRQRREAASQAKEHMRAVAERRNPDVDFTKFAGQQLAEDIDVLLRGKKGRAKSVLVGVGEEGLDLPEDALEELLTRGAVTMDLDRLASPGVSKRLKELRENGLKGFSEERLGAVLGTRLFRGVSREAVGPEEIATIIARVGRVIESVQSLRAGEKAADKYFEVASAVGESGMSAGGATKLFLHDLSQAHGKDVTLEDALGEITKDLDEFGKKNVFARPDDDYIGPSPFVKTLGMFDSPLQTNAFLATMDTFHSMWKPLVTSFPTNVSYFTRNLVGLVWLGITLGEMGPRHMVKYGTHARAMQARKGVGETRMAYSDEAWAKVKARRELAEEDLKRAPAARKGHQISEVDPTDVAGDIPGEFRVDDDVFLRLAREHGGVASGYREGVTLADPATQKGVAAVARKVTGQADRPYLSEEYMKAAWDQADQGFFKSHGFHLLKYGRTMAEAMDNNFKIGGMLHRIVEKGDTIEEAAKWARKTYFNYNEVGEWTKYAAALVPFARWTRLNIPAQLDTLIHHPHKVSKVALGTRANMEASKAHEEERLRAEYEQMPDWILEKHHVVLGREPSGALSVLYGLGLPLEDLNKLFAGGRGRSAGPFFGPVGATMENLIAETTPILRIPVEGWALDRSLFTGEPISDPGYRNFYSRVHGLTEKLPGLREFLGVERLERDDGTPYYRANNPANVYLFASLIGRPVSEAGKLFTAVEDRARTGHQLVNFFTGVKTTQIYPQPPVGEEFRNVLGRDPFLDQAFREHQSIPLYSALTAEEGNLASRALSKIYRYRNMLYSMYPDMQGDPDGAFREALRMYSNTTRDEEGAALAERVKFDKLKRDGSDARRQFRFRQYDGALERAIQEMSPLEFDILSGAG